MARIAGWACMAGAALFGGAGAASAATYYVSTTGRDDNAGTTAAVALRSLQAAADRARAGDTVYVLAGTYTSSDGGGKPGGPIVYIAGSGAPGAPITFAAFPGTRPKLYVQGVEGVQLGTGGDNRAPAYITIEGFEITGRNPAITLDYARAHGGTDGTLRANCILVDGMDAPVPFKPHHIVIRNNLIHDCPGAGVATVQADYVTIEDNHISGTSLYSSDGQSAIAMWQDWNSDDATGVKNVIRRNVVDHNRELVPFSEKGKITDGNGIIIDDGDNTQNGSTLGEYRGRTLIAANLIHDNGGYGITAFRSQHVDIVNNTVVNDAQEAGFIGELNIGFGKDIDVVNNIFVAEPGAPVTVVYSSGGIDMDYNIYDNGARNTRFTNSDGSSPVVARMGAHDLRAPAGLGTQYAPTAASPAVESGIAFAGVTTDLHGVPFAAGARERGAIAFGRAGKAGR